jgi:hypothetical protein
MRGAICADCVKRHQVRKIAGWCDGLREDVFRPVLSAGVQMRTLLMQQAFGALFVMAAGAFVAIFCRLASIASDFSKPMGTRHVYASSAI